MGKAPGLVSGFQENGLQYRLLGIPEGNGLQHRLLGKPEGNGLRIDQHRGWLQRQLRLSVHLENTSTIRQTWLFVWVVGCMLLCVCVFIYTTVY